MQAMRLLIALAASTLAIGHTAARDTFPAVCWTLFAVVWIVLVVGAEDGR
ncbi:hypothetical protein ACIF6K_26610 [Streptomyces sp. NPDC085942]